MGAKKDNAIGLYMEGIRDGKAREAIAKYTGDRYTQHSTGVADGREGFIAFFEPFLQRNPVREIKVIRGLEDGPHVFLHVYQSLNNGEAEWVTADFFDTDQADKIIEHWDVIAPFSAATPSGRTSLDGPAEITDRELTEKNKEIVGTLVNEVLIPGAAASALQGIVSPAIVQHDPDLASGLEAYAAHVSGESRALRYDRLVLLVGEGNFVATLCRVFLDGVETAHVDVYRLEDGLIVERWTNAEPVPPAEELANGGKF